jgi:serine/threonine-protein kinase
MEILCTRPHCPRPKNFFADLDRSSTLKTVQQKYCTSCGMPLILAGRYLPRKLLGEGGFGRAFLAFDRYTPTIRSCVVKQFQPSGKFTQQQLEVAQNLFEREAEVLEKLGNKHKQIPDLYAFFPLIVPSSSENKEEQFFYLVQEFIDGQTLEEELAAKGRFSESEVRLILTEILPVLQFVHENGSIHRDIKPSNIMRSVDGTLFLLDFGAVKQVTAGASNNPKGSSTGIYSIGFAPPEQMSGTQVYPSTDLYSLAVTCVNLLTGKITEELYDTYTNRWNWRNYAPQISDRLAEILDRSLLPTPSDRFASAKEVLDALNSANFSSTTMQKPPPTPTSTPQKVRVVTTPSFRPQKRQPSFSLLEILSSAAFTGFEGVLLSIAFASIFSAPGIYLGLLGMSLGGLIFLQNRRIIEKIDLLIIACITLALVWFVPALHGLLVNNGLDLYFAIVLSVLAAAAAISVTALFRLIYQLLSRLV